MYFPLKHLLFALGLSFFFCQTSTGQRKSHLGKKEGLVNGTINAFERDSLGYLWIGTDQGLNRHSGVEFKNYTLEGDSHVKGKGVVDFLNLDDELFLITSSGSLFKYDYQFDRFDQLLSLEDTRFLSVLALNDTDLLIGLSNGFIVYDLSSKQVSNVQHESLYFNRELQLVNGLIYAATSKGLLQFEYTAKSKTLRLSKTHLSGKDVIDFSFDLQNRIWVGTEVAGLFIIDGQRVKTKFLGDFPEKVFAIREIEFNKTNQALVAVDRLGLFVIDENLEIINTYSHDVDRQNSLTQNSIYEIYVDDSNTYWLGLSEGGIDLIYPKENPFKNIRHIQNEPNSINNNSIRSIYQSSKGEFWFGTENGISKYAEGTWKNFNKNPMLYNSAVLSINEYNDQLILGSYGEGLLQLDDSSGQIDQVNLTSPVDLNFIFTIGRFGDNLWVGGSGGPLFHFYNSNLINRYPVGLVRSIVKGYDEIVYVGTDSGFFEINKRNTSIRNIKPALFNALNEVHDLNFDQLNNCIWVGAKNGMYKYNLSDESLKRFSNNAKNALGTVFSIERDNMQNLYLACISGLWKFNIKDEFFRKYTREDGLLIDEFGFGASAKFEDGTLAFGGPNGAVFFDPIALTNSEPITDIFISNFQINGKKPDSSLVSKNINYTKALELDFDKNSFSFNFETVKFHGSKRHLYEWKLAGYDDAYLSTFGSRKISYSNLKPGTYQLHYRGANPEGERSDFQNTIQIKVMQPFWKTWWAFVFYFLVFGAFGYLTFRITKANNRKRFDENRIKFFVEVAHDIRTPVSLIQLLVKQLSNQENIEKSIELIQRNTQNLNEYVTQLLDFQKIDRKQLKLQVSKVDLKDCLLKIISNFSPILQEKSLDINLKVKHIPVWFDVAKMNRIFYNMISNAIKYSNEGGEITIRSYLDDNNLKIEFEDNGIGIPEKQQELIFKRFTRGTNVSNKGIPGTGIGLLLSKKIIELHGGKILLQSKENIGSKFTIVLPSGSEQYNSSDLLDENKDPKDADSNVENLIGSERLILLVEDGDELRQAIKSELSKRYTVIEAPNGKEGLLMALSKNPDLIVTDVMMPEMDGNEMCNLLKTNFKTSHIPVVMLTALADIDDKVKGLKTGADAYVEKPFNVTILTATIDNLIKSRENITGLLKEEKIEKSLNPDERFLSDVIEIIKQNLTNKDFSIDKLCEEMGLSRSNLFRKLKGLIQMSPSDLIIKIKLNRSEELMKNKSHSRISDIAYESGFHDPKYFSTLFKKHYGKTPREFIEEL